MSKKTIHESFYKWTDKQYLKHISEETVDKVLQDLKLNPDEIVLKKDKEAKSRNETETLKNQVWSFLATIIGAFGNKSDTEIGINAQNLCGISEGIERELSSIIRTLRKLEYENLYSNNSSSPEFKIANKIREASHKKVSKKYKPASDNIKIQEYEKNGYWGKYCPFDKELPVVLELLEKINLYVKNANKEFSMEIFGQGRNKKSKDDHDNLIYGICLFYKQYTKKAPKVSNSGSSTETRVIKGDIINLLQTILPNTGYNGSVSNAALEKKIKRMKKDDIYKDLWKDDKK